MPDSAVDRMVCVVCGESYPLESNPMTCQRAARRGPSISRPIGRRLERTDPKGGSFSAGGDISQYARCFREVLGRLPSVSGGGNAVVPAFRLRERFELPNLWIKDESRQPSASLKDRASRWPRFTLEAWGLPLGHRLDRKRGFVPGNDLRGDGMEAVIFVPEALPGPNGCSCSYAGRNCFRSGDL
jgi:hypothetical protein